MSLVFTEERKPVSIDWKDGAVLKVVRPTALEVMEEMPVDISKDKSGELYYLYTLKAAIIDWSGLVGKHTLPDGTVKEAELKYSRKLKADIFDSVLADAELLKKINIVLQGETKNLASGSTVSMSTGGTPQNVESAK